MFNSYVQMLTPWITRENEGTKSFDFKVAIMNYLLSGEKLHMKISTVLNSEAIYCFIAH